jgi:NADH:ubiquinone oxidoreductase subunit 5 (subunit L)/multisubunit Na+/H+ antiporter MnhA subunit
VPHHSSQTLATFPGFAGFYSKDMIIEAVHFSSLPYADWVYYAVVVGVFITAFYSFTWLNQQSLTHSLDGSHHQAEILFTWR